MPYDEMELKTDEILTGEELETAEPAAEAEDVPAEPEVNEPETEEELVEIDEIEEPDDGLVAALGGLRDAIAAINDRLAGIDARVAAIDQREAARNKKLTGFFAPVPDGKATEPGEDPLPRIERKYIY